MYPYNRNTQLYHSRAKETQAEKPSLLAQDKRLEELLFLARTEATETARKFETLLDRAELSEAGQILRTMYLDGKKHLRLLQEVGFLIFGTTPQENEACETEEATEATDTCALLEELLLAEMDDISFYRALLFAMTEADLRNAFFEILTDKQNHAVALPICMQNTLAKLAKFSFSCYDRGKLHQRKEDTYERLYFLQNHCRRNSFCNHIRK